MNGELARLPSCVGNPVGQRRSTPPTQRSRQGIVPAEDRDERAGRHDAQRGDALRLRRAVAGGRRGGKGASGKAVGRGKQAGSGADRKRGVEKEQLGCCMMARCGLSLYTARGGCRSATRLSCFCTELLWHRRRALQRVQKTCRVTLVQLVRSPVCFIWVVSGTCKACMPAI